MVTPEVAFSSISSEIAGTIYECGPVTFFSKDFKSPDVIVDNVCRFGVNALDTLVMVVNMPNEIRLLEL